MKTYSLRIPEKVCEALQRPWPNMLTFAEYDNNLWTISRVLTDKEIKLLYNGKLLDFYVNWEFICSNWDLI